MEKNYQQSVNEFLGFDIEERVIEEAIRLSSKENMKRFSKSDIFMKSKRKDFHFVRSGVSGEGHKNLPEIGKLYFFRHKRNLDIMLKLGYLEKEEKDKYLSLVKNKKRGLNFMEKCFCRYYDYKYRIKNKISVR